MHTELSHHLSEVQFVSSEHDVPHAPLVVLHTLPAGWPAQSDICVHFPHDPWDPPLKKQNGLALEVQACPPPPRSAVHAVQAPLALHVGVVPLHCDKLEAEHTVHAPEPWHAGVPAAGQGRLFEPP